jgi:Outer membrane cobalamin receptor protein
MFAPFAYSQQIDTLKLHQLSEVEVVEKARPSTTRTGAPVQWMTTASIQRLGLQDLSEAVKRFSGVTVKDYGGIGGLKTVSIRSFGAQHTAVSYDGIAITDAQSGQVDISRFSLDNVEQISLTIGQSDDIFQTARMYASAGALSIKTAKPLFDKKKYNLSTRIGGGSFGLFTPSVQYAYQLSNKWAIATRADWSSAKGEYPFKLTNGKLVTEEKRKNSDVQSLRLEGNLYGDIAGGELKAKLYYYDSERGLPGSVVYYNDYAKERLWDNNFFGQVQYRKDMNNHLALQSSARYSYTYSKYRNIDSMLPDGIQVDRNTQQEYYLSAGVLYRTDSPFSTSLTSDISYNTLANNFENAISPERITSLTAFALQYHTSHLILTGSLLGTYIYDEVKKGDRPADKKRLSPSLTISWRPFDETNLRVRASYKDIFRVPTFTDLYYQRIGNTNLKPERALQYNIGLTWSGESRFFRYMSASVDAYYNKAEDKILAIPTMHIWKMRNLGEVESKGLDINLHIEKTLASSVAVLLSATYSYIKAIDITDPENKVYRHQIQYTPRHLANTSVSLENPWFTISYHVNAVDKRYSLPQNIASNRLPGYVEHNISLNRTFSVGKTNLRVQGEVLNLTDKTYDIVRYYPMPGRSWRLNLSLIF